MKVEIDNLITIKTFADKHKVTTSYIYKMIKENKIAPVVIDEMKFIDVSKYPNLSNK
ncbi:MAG: hypothetical protein K1X54_11535 [Flavobacteriales bacterium]|nr:hypothetical protein [Flavobacteriales bacterium]